MTRKARMLRSTQSDRGKLASPTARFPLRQNTDADKTARAMEAMELYCKAHPGSPSAVRRPRLIQRGSVWIVLLGPSVEDGIAGFGYSVEGALGAFDAQYLRGLRPPAADSSHRIS